MKPETAGRIADGGLVGVALALPFSIAVSELALGVAIVAWLFSAPGRRPVPGARPLVFATLALLATWLLASATASDPAASFLNARKLYSIVLVFIVMDRARVAATGRRLAGAALAAGAGSAVFGILHFASVRVAGTIPGYRLESVFSTAMTTGNVFATLAIAALGTVLLRLRAGRGAGLPGLAFLVIAAALLGTLTRSSWLAFVAGASLLFARLRPRWLFVAILIGIPVVAFGPVELRDRLASIFDPTYETNAGRISLWKSGAAVVRDHPLTGVGLADHYGLIERYRRDDATFHAGHFHNNFVQVAASTGGLGFVAYVAWMGIVAALLIRGAGSSGGGPALVGLAVWLGFQVHGLFDWSFGDAEVVNQFFLWLGLGLAAGAAPPTGSEGAPASPSPETN